MPAEDIPVAAAHARGAAVDTGRRVRQRSRGVDRDHPARLRPKDRVRAPAFGVDAMDMPDDRMPSFTAALRVWLKIGLLSFGGPAGQIAMLHREVVDQRGWIGERRFLHALNFCTLLPGPEAQQLATYLGWLMHGVKGGLAAGIIFVLPGAVVMLALSLIYALAGQIPVVDALFFGLKSAVLVLVIEALLRIGRRALKGRVAWGLAAVGFVALFFFGVPFPAVVLITGAIGAVFPGHFSHAGHGQAQSDRPALIDALLAADPGRPARLASGARRAGMLALALWLVPVVALMAFFPGPYADLAWFFSKMAVVTIGGAYAVLAYVAQDAVQTYHWLAPPEMLAGLGLAETTPGPLILVLQFVGFLAGFRAPGALTGVAGGVAASALTLWVTFTPCFAFVFLGAPLIERLQANPALSGALAAITAAVVGVIANLAVWFALHVLFRQTVHVAAGGLAFDSPVPGSLDWAALALAAVAFVALFRLKLGVMPTLAVCAVASIGVHWVRAGF
jgi:chromate transporter